MSAPTISDPEIGDADRGDEVETLTDRIEVAFASCGLVHGGTITQDQADRLDHIYAHRHSRTHELVEYLVDPDLNPDVELFVDAMLKLCVIANVALVVDRSVRAFRWRR